MGIKTIIYQPISLVFDAITLHLMQQKYKTCFTIDFFFNRIHCILNNQILPESQLQVTES